MSGIRFAFKPDDANPPELPWMVSRYGRAIRWFRFEPYAAFYAVALSRGMTDAAAMAFVKAAPDDLETAKEQLKELGAYEMRESCDGLA